MTAKKDGTIGDVMTYLDDLVIRYHSGAPRITPLKSAVKRVFSSTKGEQWRTFLISDADLDQTMADFKLRSAREGFSDHTFAAYRARVSRAFKWYGNFLEDDEWEPFGGARPFIDRTPEVDCYAQSALCDNLGMAEYPFPFLAGGETRLKLPAKLTRRDAERLKKFIDALVVEEGEAG